MLLEHAWLRRVLRLSVTVLAIAAVYAIAVIAAGPAVIGRALERYVAAAPERTATIERARVNPFTLRITLSNLDIHDGAGGIDFSAPEAAFDFSIASLLARRTVLDGVTIERPTVTFERPMRRIALARALKRISIETFTLRDGRLALVDRTTDRERRYALREIRLDISDLDGRAQAAAGGRYQFEAVDDSDARIALEGSLGPGLADAHGPLSIRGLELGSLPPWLTPALAAHAPSGRIDLAGEARISVLASTPALDVDAHVDAEAFALASTAGFTVGAPRLRAHATMTLAPDPRVRLDLDDQTLTLTDARTPATSAFDFANVTGTMTAGIEIPTVALDLTGRLNGAGSASLELGIPDGPAAGRTVSLMLTDVPAERVSAYVTDVLGRAPHSGSIDIELDYTDRDARASGTLRVRARAVGFDGSDATADPAQSTRVELAAALLEDRDQVITLDVPMSGARGTGGLGAIVSAAVRARVRALAAAPFTALGPLAGLDPNALRQVPFEPGAAALGPQALTTIDGLARALRERPRLGMRVRGGFDGRADRDALARQQIELHVLLATAGPSPQARPQPVDFASPRAQDVLDEFASERLSAGRRGAIRARFDCPDGDTLCRTAYYAAVFEALVESESIAEGTLARLGRFRAQSIANALIERGIDARRVTTATGTALLRAQRVGMPIEVYPLRESAPDPGAPQAQAQSQPLLSD